MEKDPNLQLFYSGIVDALKTGHIKPEYVIHEGWGQSVFSGSIVDISFYYVLFELIQKCESNALEKIAKIVGEMNDGKDFYSRRLTIDELYETLSIIRFEAASFLLGKIECTDGVYSEARNALNNEDKSRFVEAIKGCNTIQIKPVVNCVLFCRK